MVNKCLVSFRVKNCPQIMVRFGAMAAAGYISDRAYRSIVADLCMDAQKNKKTEKEKTEYREFYKKKVYKK